MALHRLTALALVGALALGASGCGDDSPAPSPRTSSAAASPTPTPSAGSAAPVLPDLATRKDEVGAKAFVKYWFAAVTYAMQTGDTQPFIAVSAKECTTCSNLKRRLEEIYGAGGSTKESRWELASGLAPDPSADWPFRRFLVQVRQPKHVLRTKNGHQQVPTKVFPMRVTVVWRQGGWQFQEGADGFE